MTLKDLGEKAVNTDITPFVDGLVWGFGVVGILTIFATGFIVLWLWRQS